MEKEDLDEYGSCPNCNAQGIHISELGEENGKVCCLHCYEAERNNSPLSPKRDKK